MASREIDVACPIQAELGEGPLWDETDQTLLFVDILSRRVHRFSPESGTVSCFETPSEVGVVGLRADGGLVMGLADGFYLGERTGSGIERVPGLEIDPALRFNDGEVDPHGRFVAGTMERHGQGPVGRLYSLSPDGSVKTLLTGVTVSNGLAFSEDGGTVYYVDTPTRVVDRFKLDPLSGALEDRQTFASIPPQFGMPDGMTIDVEGCLWVACASGGHVCRFSPEGELLESIKFPVSFVSSVAFGGPRLEQLFVTSGRAGLSAEELAAQPHAGDLFVFDPGVAGRPPARFG